MTFKKKFNDLRYGRYSETKQTRVELRREFGAITRIDREIQERAHQLCLNTVKPIVYTIAEAGHICCRILYSMDGVTIDHFRNCFVPEFDMSRASLRGNVLIIDIPLQSWKQLKLAFDRVKLRDIYRELTHYFSDFGMTEFFDHLRDVYFSYYDKSVRRDREALHGVCKTLEIQRDANERRQENIEHRRQAKELSDFREVRNYRARDLGRLGRV